MREGRPECPSSPHRIVVPSANACKGNTGGDEDIHHVVTAVEQVQHQGSSRNVGVYMQHEHFDDGQGGDEHE